VNVELEPAEHLRETPVSRREIHRGRLLHVVDDEVRLEDGTIAHREVVEHPGAVAIVALDDQERVVLVRQWRHPAGRALWELPAGTCDRDEHVDTTASRELQEETGFRAGSWQELGRGFLSPGYSTEEMRFYLARGLIEGDPGTDPDERVDVGIFDPAEVRALVASAQVDVKTMAGLALAGWGLRDQ